MRQSAGRRPFGCAVALRTRSQQGGNASYDAGVKILNQFFCNCLTSSLSGTSRRWARRSSNAMTLRREVVLLLPLVARNTAA